ncbi:MAG TPA: hypothetical protein VMZ91_07140 [Candidatus Paceibacterota bacterium]|nr:hypothetical protein [Candidatus Paceibacterota bacterium]
MKCDNCKEINKELFSENNSKQNYCRICFHMKRMDKDIVIDLIKKGLKNDRDETH